MILLVYKFNPIFMQICVSIILTNVFVETSNIKKKEKGIGIS